MSPLIKMALSNVLRAPSRSLITVLAVATGLSALMFLWAFSEGSNEDMRTNTIELMTGHLQIVPKGFDDRVPGWRTVEEADALIQKAEQNPAVAGAAPRVYGRALLSTGKGSKGVFLMGIDVEKEANVTRIHQKIVDGNALSGERREVLIGRHLAKKLDAGVGDEVVAVSRDRYGVTTGVSCRVKGIFKSGSSLIDERFIYVPIADARELNGFETESTAVVLKLRSRAELPRFISEFAGHIDAQSAEIRPWFVIAPTAEQWIKYWDDIIRVIMIVVTGVVAVSIMNTVLMSVMERTKEFGILIAIGMHPAAIVRLVLLETVFLTAAGIAAGLALGSGLVAYYGTAGVSLAAAASALETNFMSSVVYPFIVPQRVLQSVGMLAVLTVVAALYPAHKASTLRPIQAIYFS